MRSHRSAGADSDATSPLLAWTAVMGCRGSSGMSGVWAVCAVFGGVEAVAELAGCRLCRGAMSWPDALPALAAVCGGAVCGMVQPENQSRAEKPAQRTRGKNVIGTRFS